jgi:hypothetical protein
LIVVPPPMGSERYPALAATPGDYVPRLSRSAWQTKRALDKQSEC